MDEKGEGRPYDFLKIGKEVEARDRLCVVNSNKADDLLDLPQDCQPCLVKCDQARRANTDTHGKGVTVLSFDEGQVAVVGDSCDSVWQHTFHPGGVGLWANAVDTLGTPRTATDTLCAKKKLAKSACRVADKIVGQKCGGSSKVLASSDIDVENRSASGIGSGWTCLRTNAILGIEKPFSTGITSTVLCTSAKTALWATRAQIQVQTAARPAVGRAHLREGIMLFQCKPNQQQDARRVNYNCKSPNFTFLAGGVCRSPTLAVTH